MKKFYLSMATQRRVATGLMVVAFGLIIAGATPGDVSLVGMIQIAVGSIVIAYLAD